MCIRVCKMSRCLVRYNAVQFKFLFKSQNDFLECLFFWTDLYVVPGLLAVRACCKYAVSSDVAQLPTVIATMLDAVLNECLLFHDAILPAISVDINLVSKIVN